MIRPYKEEDLEIVTDIAVRAFKPVYKAYEKIYGQELFNILFPYRETRAGRGARKRCLEHPEHALICEREGETAGFITFNLDEEKKIGEICYNAKDPRSTRKGVGREMYEAVFSIFKERGMLYAKVSTGNEEFFSPARKAYEGTGFNISRGTTTYYKKL